MDYKKIYQESFDKSISDTEVMIINELKASRKKDRNTNTVLNEIGDKLCKNKEAAEEAFQKNYLDIFKSQHNATNEYESNHFENFLKHDLPTFYNKYSESELMNSITDLGVYKAKSKATINFPNSRLFLEYAYVLDNYYEKYTLNFDDQNSNPVNTPFFEDMKKERYPDSRPEPGISLTVDIHDNNNSLETSFQLDENEKYYLMKLLWEIINSNRRPDPDMKKTEFMRIIVLTQNIFETKILTTLDTSSISSYQKFKKEYSSLKGNEKIDFLTTLQAKANRYNLRTICKVINGKIKESN